MSAVPISDADPAVTPPLAPGASDPRSNASIAGAVQPPLGPGDADPRSIVQPMTPVVGPARPGDGPDDDEYEMRPPPPLGPGALQVPQPSMRVRRRL